MIIELIKVTLFSSQYVFIFSKIYSPSLKFTKGSPPKSIIEILLLPLISISFCIYLIKAIEVSLLSE